MDEHTLKLLEWDKIREIVASHAASPLGKDLARELLPLRDVDAIQLAIKQTSEMADALNSRLEPPSGRLQDVRLAVRRASLDVLLELDQLAQIRDILDLSRRTSQYAERLTSNFPTIAKLLSGLPNVNPLLDSFNTLLDERGQVPDSASPELREVRRKLADLDERVQAELKRLLRNPEIRRALQYQQSTLSGDHHVLPVLATSRHKIPGVVHRTSASGETVYIEPSSVAAIAADRALLKNAEEREVRKVLRRLTTIIGKASRPLLEGIDILAKIDLIRAKARYSLEDHLVAPFVAEAGGFKLERARHPLLLRLFREEANAKRSAESEPPREVVPIDVTLGAGFRVLVITGPNTGGKTVALKTTGLIAAMAHAGLHVPTREGSRVPFLVGILADIGDEQSLEQSLSTFSSHITRIAGILHAAGPRTLVLLDELGAGTEPTEGAALGRAIIDELVDRRCHAMVTTHLGSLKKYAFHSTDVENGAMEFDAETLRPTYELVIGQYGQSCALKIASRLNLPVGLVKRAKGYLRSRDRDDRKYEDLQRLRKEAIDARDQAESAQREAQQAEDDFRKKAEQLAQEASISAEMEKARASIMPGDTVRVPKFDKQGTVVRVDTRRELVAVTVGAVEWELPLEQIVPVSGK